MSVFSTLALNSVFETFLTSHCHGFDLKLFSEETSLALFYEIWKNSEEWLDVWKVLISCPILLKLQKINIYYGLCDGFEAE